MPSEPARLRPNPALLRLGGISAVLGGIITPPCLVTRPHTDPYAPIEETMRTYAEHTAAFDGHALGVTIGLLLLFGGFIGPQESLRSESQAQAWGRLGLGMATVATTLTVFFVLLDVPAMSRIAEAWMTAPEAEKAPALRIAEAVYTLDTIVIIPLHLGLFITFLLFGIGVWQSNLYHRWFGWIGIGLGLIGVVVGGLALRQGVPTGAAQLRDGVVLIALFVWFIVDGISMLRESKRSEGAEIFG